MKRITVTFTDRQAALIEGGAKYHKISHAEVVRRCVRKAYLTECKKWWEFWK